MKRVRFPHGAAVAVLGLALAAACVGACGDDRKGFEHRETTFESDGGGTVDAPDCRQRCSLDGRSVIDGCTGAIVKTCPVELACGAAACMEPCAAASADRSSNGCEFYFQAPRFEKKYPQQCYAAFVVNTSLQAAKVSLELEGKALDLSKAMFRTTPGSAELIPHQGEIPPGESVVLFVSDRDPSAPPELYEDYRVPCPSKVVAAAFVDRNPNGTGTGASFHLSSNVPVATTTIYPFGGARTELPSATLVLPVTSWAEEHMIVDGWEVSNCGAPATQIVAAADDTEVTLRPKRDVQDGNGVRGGPAGSALTYRLSKGQHLQFFQDEELTGSILTSNKPTAVFGGHSCAWIPEDVGSGDSLGQQIPPYQQWGSEYVGVGYRPRLGNEHEPMFYRIVAAHDGTQLDYDPALPPGAPVTMNAGEVATFQSGTGDAFVVRTQDADHPVYLAAYMTGQAQYKTMGDPEFVNVVPAGQYLSSYSFYADTTYAETSLVVVRAKASGTFKDVWLECAGNLTGWKPIGTRGDYEFVRVDLQRQNGPGETFGTSVCQVGLQRMRSEGAFTATLWGWARVASYAYPGGMAQRKLVEASLGPIR
jgi:IgGFc binding protein